ncbi:MAG: prepilin-type N-terminal cleavage/methylation domain-containing protein [Thermoleophilaceae bacterium]
MAEFRSLTPWRLIGRGDDGFTLIELSITIAVLLVGVLGTVALIDGASATTANNKAREGATALAREMTELTRSVPYDDLDTTQIPVELQSRPGLADSSADPGYTLERRDFTFTVSVSACSVDDGKDGLGSHGGAVTFCPESSTTGANDRNPDDYRRVTVGLTWTRNGRDETARQTTLVTNPAGGLGPSVKDFQILSPATATITSGAITDASFDVQTSATPESVEWYVNGAAQGVASGSGTDWNFTWPVASFLDGTYLVQARAFNEEGRSGVARVMTVVLNRFAPQAPQGVGAGRNGTGSDVDVEWHANGEGDVIGYRVYRVTGGIAERACPEAGAGTDAFLEGTLSCVDPSAPAGGPLEYTVMAIDRDAEGQIREGGETAAPVAEGNSAPGVPGDLVTCAGGTSGCNGPDGTPAPSGTTAVSWSPATDPDTGDTIAFYRIYRDGTGYSARLDRLYPTGGPLVWVDDETGGTAHEYRVSAVDQDFAESTLAGPVAG